MATLHPKAKKHISKVLKEKAKDDKKKDKMEKSGKEKGLSPQHESVNKFHAFREKIKKAK